MANKNDAKRVPVSAVFTVDIDLGSGGNLPDGRHSVGFIEGNIAITRVMLVVDKAFVGTTPTATVEETVDGNTGTHFTGEDISVEGVHTSLQTLPTGAGTPAPLYNLGKGEWFVSLIGSSTTGSLKVVVEYTQLDTEPGLHSATNS